MKIKKKVTSFEISKKLKELGVKQEFEHGDWAYCGCCNELNLLHDDNDEGNFVGEDYKHRFDEVKEWVRAFTVAELGEILPDWVGTIRTTKNEKHKYWICSDEMGDSCQRWPEGPCPEAETEADARAKMLIYLLENKLITL